MIRLISKLIHILLMKFLGVCKMNGSIIRNVLALCILALCSVFITNTFMPYECWSDEVGVDNKSESISTDEIALLSNSLQPEVTWTSRNNPNSTILESGYNLEGDHIIIKAELIPENSSMTKTKMEFFGKSQLNVTHPLMLITRNNPIYQIDLDWVIVENITKGLMVNIEVNFSNSNCDIYAWWNDELIDDELDFSSNLLDNQMATTSKPERGSFIPDRTGNLAIGCFNTSNSTGNWSLLLNQTCIEFESDESDIEVDTFELARNIECELMVTWYDDENEIALQSEFSKLSINNFFAPTVGNITIDDSDSANFTISWDIYDLNADDNHFYSILFSRDAGDSWQLLARDLVTTSFYWDTRPFLEGDEWMLQIRAYDNDFSVNPNATCINDCWPGLMGRSFTDYHFTPSGPKTPYPTSFTTTTLISNTNVSNSPTQITNTLWLFILPVSICIIMVFSLCFISRRHKLSY